MYNFLHLQSLVRILTQLRNEHDLALHRATLVLLPLIYIYFFIQIIFTGFIYLENSNRHCLYLIPFTCPILDLLVPLKEVRQRPIPTLRSLSLSHPLRPRGSPVKEKKKKRQYVLFDS